ncbi:hypothetical protein [Methyloradius palustris]|uniref:Transmembrane protein n=1 Tax=Methyloradius palustris TaxID=2778876 RepID=A0A8D5GCK9_9PROT|nr:hypothetical protein [Methyloradius palustris]BCM25801.1 hypothetical protein ZMTM_20600 [Methyloradius palustris]
MTTSIISAKQQMRSAQAFAFFSSIAVVIPVLIFIWIAASIFVYAAVANHPNQRVRDYLIPAGYRFYGLVGTIVVIYNFSSQLAKWAGGYWSLAIIIWIAGILIVVPLAIRDIMRAEREPWQEMQLETE